MLIEEHLGEEEDKKMKWIKGRRQCWEFAFWSEGREGDILQDLHVEDCSRWIMWIKIIPHTWDEPLCVWYVCLFISFYFFFLAGNFGIICLEDLIHEIYSAGRYFRNVTEFLWPFHLSVARHAARNKVGFLKEIGKPGCRGEGINQLIRQLN